MAAEWDLICRELLLLAKRRDCRRTDFSPTIPCDWAPQSVFDPQFEMTFTSEGAWSFIVDLLESGYEFNQVTMTKPPDTVAYEAIIDRGPNLPALYIKVQRYKGKILGRSFHNSVR